MVRTTSSLLALLATASLSAAEDSLYSKRFSKRFIDGEGNYNISFYHINDVHAHLDQFSSSGTDCTNPQKGCYGGYARVKTVLDETRPEHPDSLLLNVGDEFQGTLFYTFYGGEKIAETLNQIGFDAMTLGNHEWDAGDDKLGDFLKNLTFPIVSANVVSDNEKLNSTIKPYHIFPAHSLAIIGATTETVPSISNPGDGTTFTDVVAAVQRSVDEIRSTTNITRIAAITHIGYDEDRRLARETSGLQLIMGGHSHTLLLPTTDPNTNVEGPYPTIETNKDGDEVFIVTAYRWGEYLGYIDVTFDEARKILSYHGAPVHLTNATKQDEGLQRQVDEWRGPFEEFAGEVVGESRVVLEQGNCQRGECVLGDLIADAILQYRLANSSPASFAFVNAGGIRATIDSGPITRGEVLTAFPFGNAVVEITFSGSQLRTIFEGIVSAVNQANGNKVTSFVQVSKGVEVVYDPEKEVGERLVSLKVKGEEVEDGDETEFTVVTVDFVAGGGDNFFGPVENLVVLDTLDEVLVEYVKNNSPIDFQLDGRIATVDGSASSLSLTSAPTPRDAAPSPSETPSEADNVKIVSGLVLLVWTALLAVVVMEM
ncbi:Metallo-dependent phosphatase [Nemania sp. FL0916]|nr:Metallo-dependent phosphatase [Nemania sp. FL0916]